MEIHQDVTEGRRQRSSRRLRHEAQVKVFESQAGSLENIRQKLGLRPSQICELLKVHPSAWTRWVREDKAPPHVYQMLDWYLELLQWRGQNKLPPTTPVLRQEDPQSYVPETVKPERGSLTRWLIVAWSVQMLLWCFVMILLLKHV